MPYHLYSLSPEASIRLLIDEAPREISNKEIQELLDYQIPIGHKIHQQFPTMRKGEIHMTNHPLVLMLGGHPQAISLAAPMLENQSLKELFCQLLETNIMDALDIQHDQQSYVSLRISLEISIQSLKKKKPKVLDLYMFIGLLPGGIKQKELTDMWGDNSWRSYKESLIRASLLVFRPQEDILILLPFMNAKAYELLEEEGEDTKNHFHLKC